MEAKTWGSMRLEIRNELNLGDDGLVDDTELMAMANRALQLAEGEIHSLNEDYLRTQDVLTLVNGVSTYDLPSDCFGAKLRLVEYDNGEVHYEVRRIHPKKICRNHDGQDFQYELNNSTTFGCRMVFYPTPVQGGAYVKRWYLRRASTIVDDASVVDLPEFSSFIFNYVKVQCLLKGEGVISPVLLEIARADLKETRDLMVKTLASFVVDDDEGVIEADMSFYNESIV